MCVLLCPVQLVLICRRPIFVLCFLQVILFTLVNGRLYRSVLVKVFEYAVMLLLDGFYKVSTVPFDTCPTALQSGAAVCNDVEGNYYQSINCYRVYIINVCIVSSTAHCSA